MTERDLIDTNKIAELLGGMNPAHVHNRICRHEDFPRAFRIGAASPTTGPKSWNGSKAAGRHLTGGARHPYAKHRRKPHETWDWGAQSRAPPATSKASALRRKPADRLPRQTEARKNPAADLI